MEELGTESGAEGAELGGLEDSGSARGEGGECRAPRVAVVCGGADAKLRACRRRGEDDADHGTQQPVVLERRLEGRAVGALADARAVVCPFASEAAPSLEGVEGGEARLDPHGGKFAEGGAVA